MGGDADLSGRARLRRTPHRARVGGRDLPIGPRDGNGTGSMGDNLCDRRRGGVSSPRRVFQTHQR